MKTRIFLLQLVLSLIVLSVSTASTQNMPTSAATGDSLYRSNILKSKLYGVYIPRDIPDAMLRLDGLTDADAREKLKNIDERTMARKLFFGLGRWMEYNWNFQEGSRISHLLRKKGLTYTEDMTTVMLILYHRHVVGRELNVDALIAEIAESRRKKIEEEKSGLQLIDSFRVVVPVKKQ
ncbi:MAG: hypothetical protein LW630_03500 [Saprospiraceae bacterium]|jgi:hypothetical protein|nr:hypothetical protein [Saprospiraceae bacterium]